VETTTLEELIAAYGRPFFIKIDVEGHEPSVLRGLKDPIPYLSFEVNLPEFASEGLECLGVLRDVASDGEFNYTRDCRRGLELSRWVRHGEFARIFEQIQDSSVEVFWRTPLAAHS
jgi:hypothetical protein